MGEREHLDRDPADIRREIDDTRSSIGAKLELLEETVKDTARDTYEDVKGKVEDVKRNFSLSHQVQERPWAFFGGAVGVGFVVGSLLSHKLHDQPDHDFTASTWTPKVTLKSQTNGHTNGQNGQTNGHNGYGNGHSVQKRVAETGSTPQEKDGFFNHPAVVASLTGVITSAFGQELRKAKSTAIGSVLGLVREIARDAVPVSIAEKTADAIDELTRQLGGTPVASKPRQKAPIDPETQRIPNLAASIH